jgi:HSP20 family molecular chaperone IbpA/quercetin dioxygenase-like cupin family protein
MRTTVEQQVIPVRIHRAADHFVVTAPMPGLAATDISVRVRRDTVTIRGEYRGPGQETRDLLTAEWTIGSYAREIVLPEPVNGALANATYGNGVLVLSMPVLAGGEPPADAEFRLTPVESARGQRVGHTGRDNEPMTTEAHQERMAEQRSPGRDLEASSRLGDTTVKKVQSRFSPKGDLGQRYLVSGVKVSMRLWEREVPGEPKPPTWREYETVGYVIDGRAELDLEGQVILLEPGDSWVVPRGSRHSYQILEPFTAVEATAPPAEVHGRDAE